MEIQNISAQLPQYIRIKGYALYSEPLPRTPLGKLRRFMVKDLLSRKREKVRGKVKTKDSWRTKLGLLLLVSEATAERADSHSGNG